MSGVNACALWRGHPATWSRSPALDAGYAALAILGSGLPFSKVASTPNLATILFFVSSPPVISITKVGTRRARLSATHLVSSRRERARAALTLPFRRGARELPSCSAT